MNVYKVLARDYDKRTLGERGKNEPKTNPIYPVVASGEAGTNPIYPVVASGEAGSNPIYPAVASGEAGSKPISEAKKYSYKRNFLFDQYT